MEDRSFQCPGDPEPFASNSMCCLTTENGHCERQLALGQLENLMYCRCICMNVMHKWDVVYICLYDIDVQ